MATPPPNDARQPMPPAPTPENTPVPGGGRWRWDIALPGWVEQGDADATTQTTQP